VTRITEVLSCIRWKKIVEKNVQYFFALEERVLKLHYMQLITTETDGLTVKTVHSEVRENRWSSVLNILKNCIMVK